MKTKELVKRFINSKDKQSELVEIMVEMGTEFKNIKKARNIKYDRGLIPIFKDMDKKYKSFVFKVNTHYGKNVLKYDMFDMWLKNVYPIAYKYYKNNAN